MVFTCFLLLLTTECPIYQGFFGLFVFLNLLSELLFTKSEKANSDKEGFVVVVLFCFVLLQKVQVESLICFHYNFHETETQSYKMLLHFRSNEMVVFSH